MVSEHEMRIDGGVVPAMDDLDAVIVAHFDVDSETVPAEPYSWGGSRGTEEVLNSVYLTHITINGVRMDRAAFDAAYGYREVLGLEEAAMRELDAA